MARVFISYRREEASAWAGRLYDRLSQHFGRDNVFMDIDTIEPGVDFVEVIERAVASCDVFITLIGRQWLTVTNPSGQRRLDNPEDFVRLEIATALKRNIRVIPALIQGASMPRSTDLPEDLRLLTRRNALEISDTHFHRDVDQLIVVLDKVLGTAVSETRDRVPSQSVPSQPHAPSRAATNSSNMHIMSIIIGLTALVIALVGFIPLLGYLTWFVIPLAVVGLVLGLKSERTGGRNISIVALVLAIIRLALGGGML